MKKLLPILLCLILTSCATGRALVEALSPQLTTKIVLAEVLAHNPSWQGVAQGIAAKVLQGTSQTPSLDELEALALAEIAYLETPGAQVAARELVVAIKSGLAADLQKAGLVDPAERGRRLLEFLRWLAG